MPDPAFAADVLVLGGGPAGCAAAVTARLAGLSVVLVERASFPRPRPGETLHPGVEPLLRQLGAWDRVEAAGFLRHEGHWVAWGGPRVFVPFGRDAAGPWRGVQAWRATFDAILLDRARELGATVLQPCRALGPLVDGGRVVGATTTAGSVTAGWTIDACGGRQLFSRRLGLPGRRYSPPLTAWYGYAAGRCPDRDAAPALVADPDGAGWAWTARVRHEVYAWTRLRFAPDARAGCAVPAELAGLNPLGVPRGADVTWRSAAAAGSGYALAGDAAVVLDPSAGRGVLRALMTGIAAGAAAVAGRTTPPSDLIVHGYKAWLSAWVESDVGEMRRSYQTLSKPRRT